ncbi:FAD-dependent oxidoreductase [Massiliimalia massiliensis]|uniref:FAD-dependent oxidoreductase n=1 Tax=Massiliimalia massiliensis TaxID=1852384 RepID=UPI0013566475|nr:FAD-dependent oxidoreductase [Massiliimalia massiliensis]
MKVCIVGGVAGGAGAATRLRRLDEEAQIILFERGEYISYANCGLPYYIGKEITKKEALLVTKPELLESRFRIDVRTMSEVVAIHRAEKIITVKNHVTGETYQESYDKLVLAPGAAPKRLPAEGADLPGIFSVRTVNNTLAIDDYLEKNKSSSAVVVGGGFIGVEMAENLSRRGLKVTLVELANQILPPLDLEMANILHREMLEKGISLKLNTGVEKLEQSETGLTVRLSDGTKLPADMVVLALGVSPESGLAKEAGLALSVGGSILTDENFRTSDQNIYAVGDAISIINGVSGKEALIPLAGPANRQGRSVAGNLLGKNSSNGKQVYGSSVVRVFDYVAASVGMNEKQLLREGTAYHKTYVHPNSHAGYYPGAKQISLKMLFDPQGVILGAQAVGVDGVEKQIDVIATAMKFHGTVYDLEELELCYAPPFNSAKSPVNLLGFTAANILKGDMPVFYAEDVPKLDRERVTVLDVSTPPEIKMGTLPDSINIPLDDLRGRLNELDPQKPVYLTCRVGLRGNVAARILLQHGYQAYNLSGGYKTYSLLNLDLGRIGPKASQKCRADGISLEVDARGLQCPAPICKVEEGMRKLRDGERLHISASDPAFGSDMEAWCDKTGNTLIERGSNHGVFEAVLEKGKK